MTFTGLDYMSNTAGLQLFTGLDYMSNTAGLQLFTGLDYMSNTAGLQIFTGLEYMSNTAGVQLFTGLDFMSNTAGLQFSTQTIERKKDLDTCFGNTDLNFGQTQTYGGVTPFKFAFIDVLLRVCRIFPTGHQDTFSYEECVLSPFLLLL
jgi:hypothetical protein